MDKPSRPKEMNRQEREFIKQSLIYDYLKTGCDSEEAERLAEALLTQREQSDIADSEPEST